MKSANKYVIKVIATGFVVVVALSVLFFWARKTCQIIFYENVRADKWVKICPSGLLPELDSAPEIVRKSSIEAYIDDDDIVFQSLGIVQDSRALDHGKFAEFAILGKFSTISENKAKPDYDLILFDKDSGLFVCYDVFEKKRGWNKKAVFYAGPKGISKTADKNLGRFSEPHKNLWRDHLDSLTFFDKWSGNPDSFTFFDKSLSSFFQIKFYEGTVVKGPQLPGDYSPVQMGGFTGFNKNGGSLRSFGWTPPLRKQTPQDKEDKKKIRRSTKDKDGQKIRFVSAVEENIGAYSTQYRLILDKSGGIRRLDNKTLELSTPVAYLPSAPPFSRGGSISSISTPKELFAYGVLPFTIDDRYGGTIVGCVSKEAMGILVLVFDPNGQPLWSDHGSIRPTTHPGGPLALVTTYILENLQPSIFGLASYFTASSFEATAGHRGLFILPNSFVAMSSRAATGIIGPFFLALVIISPSIILGVLLAWRVYKDAAITGFSRRAKRCWLIGTILFGICAYITYKLTKPKEALVTCQNCGKSRRPDMARCHRCGSKWVVPELTPPTWRVIDTPHKEVIS